MDNKKKAFTIVEILLVFAFIGIILVLEMQVINRKINEYGATYYSVYNSLKKIGYNVLADLDCPDCDGTWTLENPVDPDSKKICDATGVETVCPDGPRTYPTNHVELCKRLVSYFNLADDPVCDSQAIDLTSGTNKFIDEGPNRSLKFIATNSLRFYLSDFMEHDINGTKIGFFIVYVDLNGSKKPNTIEHTGSEVLPDIVPFALTQRGEVIPMGFPIYSKTYLTAKVKLPSKADAAGNPIDHITESMTFYEAANIAWVTRTGTPKAEEHADIAFSWDLNQHLTDEAKRIVVKKSGEESDKFFPDANYFSTVETAARERGRNGGTAGEVYCLGGTYNCRVMIDGNLSTRF